MFKVTEQAKEKNLALQDKNSIITEFVQWIVIFHDFKDCKVHMPSVIKSFNHSRSVFGSSRKNREAIKIWFFFWCGMKLGTE